MNRRIQASFATTALLGALAVSTPSLSWAQDAIGLPGRPRSQDERVVTQTPTPPPVNSDARKAAEGRLGPVAPVVPVVPAVPGTTVVVPVVPAVPNPNGAIDPARVATPGGPAREGQMDPAMRLEPAVRGVVPGRVAAYPAGMDVAMMVEHALSMAIEGSALKAIADQDVTSDPARALLDHANQEMADSKALLTRAATDGREVPANSPIRRFYASANNYITTLASLGTANPADKSQIAMINHAVKEVLDADHIRQMGRMAAASPAIDQLLNHAGHMRNQGSQTLLRLAGTGTVDPNLAPTPTLLAQRGRDLLDAAEQLNTYLLNPAVMVAPVPGAAVGVPPVGPNPGRFQDTRPEIIGGTFATGSPTAGTATGPEALQNGRSAQKVDNGGEVRPIPSDKPGSSNTGSTGGLRPR